MDTILCEIEASHLVGTRGVMAIGYGAISRVDVIDAAHARVLSRSIDMGLSSIVVHPATPIPCKVPCSHLTGPSARMARLIAKYSGKGS